MTTGIVPQGPHVPNLSGNVDWTQGNIQQKNAVLLNAGEQQRKAEIEKEIRQEKMYQDQLEWAKKTKVYRMAFDMLMQLEPDSFSLARAVYIIESAYFDGRMKYENFMAGLDRYVGIVRQILKREGLDPKDNLAVNYAIQKLYQQSNAYYDRKTKKTVTVKPFKYDFEDFRGEKDYFKMFVSKLMVIGSGQCHSMPLLYLLIAERLHAKAWLSLAPQHSFVRFEDKEGNLLNFEATSGNIVSDNWLTGSGFITANALKAKTYLDTLSQRQLFAQCLSDMLLGYIHKFGYDFYAEQIRTKIQSINPDNLTARILDANNKTEYALQKINEAGRPKLADLPNFPEAYKAYQTMMASYEVVDRSGYQDMPDSAYQTWLKSIEQEKKKQETRKLQEQMQRNIQLMRKPRSIVVDRTRE